MSFFLKVPRPGGEPGIFWFSFIFSLSSSALDHSATAPPCLQMSLPACFKDALHWLVGRWWIWLINLLIVNKGIHWVDPLTPLPNIFGLSQADSNWKVRDPFIHNFWNYWSARKKCFRTKRGFEPRKSNSLSISTKTIFGSVWFHSM